MAKSAFGTAAKKDKRRRKLIGWALKSTAACALLWGSYNYYVPETTRGAAAQTVSELIGFGDAPDPITAKDLQFTFTNENQPTILGAKTESVVAFTQTDMQGALAESWAAAVGRHHLLLQDAGNLRQWDHWLSQLDHLRGKSIREQATAVDALVDRQITYALDENTYGIQKSGYFAAPMETLAKQQGDCEDFAILKYYALRKLGVPSERMFIAAVAHDGTELDHATLLVDAREAGLLSQAWDSTAGKLFTGDAKTSFMILDNDGSATGRLVEERDSAYKPFMVMNETGIWTVPTNSGLSW